MPAAIDDYRELKLSTLGKLVYLFLKVLDLGLSVAEFRPEPHGLLLVRVDLILKCLVQLVDLVHQHLVRFLLKPHLLLLSLELGPEVFQLKVQLVDLRLVVWVSFLGVLAHRERELISFGVSKRDLALGVVVEHLVVQPHLQRVNCLLLLLELAVQVFKPLFIVDL